MLIDDDDDDDDDQFTGYISLKITPVDKFFSYLPLQTNITS